MSVAPPTLKHMNIPELVGELAIKYGSLSRASRKCDIPLTTLHRLKTGEHKDPRISTFIALSRALGRPPGMVLSELDFEDSW